METVKAPAVQYASYGPVESVYKLVKSYLPGPSGYTLISTVDKGLTRAVEGCDKLLNTSISTLKCTVAYIPSPKRCINYVANTSNDQLEKLETGLNHTIEWLGGAVQESSKSGKDSLSKLINILASAIEVNSLLFGRVYSQTVRYAKSPGALLTHGKNFAYTLYVQLASASIAIRELIFDVSKQVFRRIGGQLTDTTTKVKVLLTDLKNPEKAFELISERLVDFKKVTVKVVNQTIQIVIDKKHYYDNLKKLMEIIKSSVGDIVLKVDDKYEESVDFAKDLYHKVIRSYKTQKVLMNQRKGECLRQSKSTDPDLCSSLSMGEENYAS